MQTKVQRINLLDSFRFIAILLVMGFHYFARYNEGDVYPYGKEYADFFLFKYGAFGVQFFFMISGFVIFMTLERCRTLSTFLLKRFIRLYPALLLSCLVIFVTVPLLDPGHHQPYFHRPLSNFAPSLTFIDPFLWKRVLTDNTGFIDGVHWSLLVEVKFYIIAGILYFIRKEKALNLWINFVSCASALLIVVAIVKEYHLVKGSYLSRADVIIGTFLLKDYLIYFTSGILFFALYSNKKIDSSVLPGLVFSSIYLLTLVNHIEIAFFGFFTILFLIFIYRPQLLKVMQAPLILRIGLISYPLYLIHQNLGVLLIFELPFWFHFQGTFVVAIFVVIPMIVLAYFIDKYFDAPCQRILSYLLFKREKGGVKGSWISELYVSAIKNTSR